MCHKVKILLSKYRFLLITFFLLSEQGLYGQTCTGSLGDPVVNVTFGTGTGFTSLATAASGASTTYNQQSQECPNDGNYAVTNTTSGCFSNSWFTATEDHTPNDVNGRMAIYNASYTVGEFYKQTISGLCGNTTYEFAAWIANILRPSACSGAGIDPNLTFRIESLTGTLLGTYSTGNIAESSSLTWKQYGFVFTTPASQTQVILKIINNAPGGCGNDLLLDDITFRPCGPTISVSANVPSICEGSAVNLIGEISPGYTNPQFQWQQSSDNGMTWADITGATSLNTAVSSAPAGTKYRLLAAEQGNISIGYCRIASNPVALTVYAFPKLTLPTTSSIPLAYCAGTSIDLVDFSAVPAATFSWQHSNTTIGLSQTNGTGQVPVFTATNSGSSPITSIFTVTGSANGCTSQPQTFSVVINPKPTINAGIDQTICVGNSASFVATANGGTPSYTYTWDNGLSNNATQTVSPTSTTIYNVTLTDTKGCQAVDDIKITVNQLPTISSVTKTDALCNGQSNGSITVIASGVTPLQYKLNTTAYQNSNVFNNIAAGTYTVSVKDANGCVATKTIIVNQPGPMSATVTVKNVSCFDGTDGAITVDVNGGTGPYSYAWSDGTTGTGSIVGRPAGVYEVTIKDAKGCTTTASATIVEPIQISITGNATHVTCNGGNNGKIDITAASVTTIISYEWKNSSGTIIATTEDVTNLIAGTYTVTVTDADGCKLSTSYTLYQPTAISASAISSNTTCFGGSDGKISVSASGGTGALQYAICIGNNCTNFTVNQTTNEFTNLAVGTYRVRTTDANGCTTVSTNISVSQPAQLVASASNTSPVCVGAMLTLSAVNGGVGANYEWTGPNGGVVANTQQFVINNALLDKAGTYKLRVYNANGCENTATMLVKINAVPKVDAGTDQTVCEGTSAIITANASNGTSPYNYTWNNGLGSGSSKTVNPLATTDYVVAVNDINSCVGSDTVRVTVIAKPRVFNLTAPSDLTICAGVDGIPLTLSGSQTGVLYELIRNNNNIGQGKIGTGNVLDLGNYFGGTYQVKATTNTNPACMVMMSGSVVVNELPPVTAELQALDDTVCIGESMQYTVVASGGSGTGYTYTWQDGQTGNPRSFTTTDYLLVEVTIKDNRGCMVKRAANLRAVKAISLAITSNPNPICAGQQVTLNATATGATGNLKYEWENTSTNASRTVSPNTTNTYNVKVIDTKEGCTAEKEETVIVHPQPKAFGLVGGGTYCTGGGGVVVGLSGSETGFNYQLKRNGQNVGNALSGTGGALNFGNQTTVGTYTVDVTSNTTPVCSATMTGSAIVTVKTKPEITANVSPEIVCVGKLVNLSATPTIANATYAWTGPNGFTSNTQNPTIGSATSSNNGTYTVIVTLDGCTDTATVVLKVNPTPIAGITGPINLCKDNTITLNGNPSGSTTPYTHTWQVATGNNLLTLTNNNNGTATIIPTGIGTASLTYQVTDANGCQSPVVNYAIGINAALPLATVSAGAPVGFTSLIGVRFRAFNRPSDKELFLGIPDLGIAPPRRTETDLTWKTGNNEVTYEYDPATNQLKATVINSAGTFMLTYLNVLAAVNTYRAGQNVCSMNVMQIALGSQNEPTGTVAFNNVLLNGESIGNFNGAGFNNWTIRNVDFGLGFKITGTIVLTGTHPTSAETNKVDILVGNDQTPVIFGCMSANEVCEGAKSTVSFSGLRPNTTFNLNYSIGVSSNLSASVTTDGQGNGTFQTAALTNAQNGAILKIDSVQRTISGACFQPIVSNNTTTLTVNPKPVVALSIIENSGLNNNDGILCEGDSVTLNAMGGGTYSWNIGATTPSITVSPASNKTYAVTVTSNKGCQAVASKSITVNLRPQPLATNTGPVCVGDKITLSVGGGTSYEWKSPSNAVISNNATFSIDDSKITDNGTYTVKVSDANGCSQTTTTGIVVKERPLAQATSNSPKCAGQTLTLSATNAGTGAIYAWSGPNGFSKTNNQNPIIIDAQPIHSGKYLLTVTLNGCSSTTDVNVVINENPVVELLTNTPVCEESPLNFTAKDAGKGAKYEWYNSNGDLINTNATFTIPKAVLTDAGKYMLTVTNNNCVSNSGVEVLVKPLPKITLKNVPPLCATETVQLNAETNPTATKYEWSGPNGFTSPEQNPKIEKSTTDATGIYEVIASLNSCRDTARIKVVVNPKPIVVASASPPVCEGQLVTLTANDAGTGAKYEWRKDNVLVSNDKQWIISSGKASDSGIYSLIVTLGSCSNDDTALVVVYPKPTLSIGSIACAPNLKSYTVNVTAEGGVLSVSDGTITQSTTNDYIISGIKPTTNPLVVSVTSDQGCVVSQNVNAPNCSCPVLSKPISGSNKKTCEDKPLPALTVDVGNNETVDWYETASGGTPILTGSTSFTPQAAGTYYAQTRHLVHGCTSDGRTAVTLSVIKLPVVKIDSTVCGQDLSNFVIWLTTETSGVSVSASEGTAVNFTNGRYEIIAISPSGNPTVTVTVTNLEGCEQKIVVKKPDCLCPELKAPQNTGNKEVCENASMPILSVTVGPNETTDWYDAPSGGNKIATGTTQFTPTETAVGTYTFYVETRRTDITVRTCVSNTRTPVKLTIKPLPTVDATSNSAICEKENLQLTTPANANATYQWTGPNGFGSTERSPMRTNVQPNMSGEYIVVATLNACIATDTTNVLVKPLPAVNAIGAIVCENNPFTFVTNNVANATYVWTNPNNQVVANDASYTVQQALMSQVGTYQVKVTLNGCSQTDTANLVIKTLPLTKTFTNAPICSGDTLKLTAADAGVGAMYSWSNPEQGSLGQQSFAFIPNTQTNNTGKYVLTVTKNGCVKTDTANVLVKPLPTFTIGSNSPICFGDTIKLYTNNPPAGATFEWSGANEFVSFQQNPTIAPARPSLSGLYQVTVKRNGCTKTDTLTFKVNPLPVAKILTNAPVCENDTLRLTAENAGINASYEWRKLGGGIISSQPNFQLPTSDVSDTGKYLLKVMLNQCVNVDTIDVVVKKRPIFALTSNTPVCEGDSLKLFAKGAPAGTNFVWSGPLQFVGIDTMAVRPKATLGMAGLYQVTATLNGCTHSDTIRTTIKALPQVKATSNSPICEGDTLKLSTTSTTNTTYLWKTPNGIVIGNNAQMTVPHLQLNQEGKYAVVVTQNGCVNSDTILVQIKIKPAFTIDSVVCAPSLKTYTVYGKSNGSVSSIQGIVLQTDNIFSISNITAGAKAMLTFTKNNCDTTFEVNAPTCVCPSLAPTVNPENQTICEGEPLQILQATVSAGATADWYDAPTGGNLLAAGTHTFKPSSVGKLYVEARAEISGCLSNTRAVSEVVVHPKPSFNAGTVGTSCDGLDARKDGKLQVTEVVNGKRYDFSMGSTYTGNKIFANATALPLSGILADTLPNPVVSSTYTIRIFDSTGCYADRVATLLHRDCICPAPPFVVPESQRICEGDSLRTIRGFVAPGITIDWYDEQGNLLKKGSIFFKPTQAGTYYAQARDTLSGCKGIVRVPSYASINPHPSFQGVVTRGTCDGVMVRSDAKISILDIKNGKRYDYVKGKIYTSNKTYDNATEIPNDGVILKNLANPTATDFYTVRIFDSTGCYTDSVLIFEPRICECPRPPFVVPESQAICKGDTLRTVKGFVDSGVTVDWYDAPTGGTLLKRGDIFFKPTQAGIYYAEARDTTTNCKGTVRVPSFAFVNDLPTFELETQNPSCVDFVTQTDGKITIKSLKNGVKYDFSIGSVYVGDKNFDTAKDIPADSVLFNQVPNSTQTYTVRVFGEPNCFTDKIITFSSIDCGCRSPSFAVVVTRGTCDGVMVKPDAKITIVDIKNGKRFDYSNAKTYQGNKIYTTATDIPNDGVILKNLANPTATDFYTVRVFDSTGCYTDSVLIFEPRICECPRPPFVVPESQTICEGDTLQTVQGFVDSGITVDWYDAPTGGNLLKKGDIFFKPVQGGTYYAEARDTLSGCKSTVRVASYAFLNVLPTFELTAQSPSCLRNTAQNDATIKIKSLANGTKFDYSIGDKYIGNRTYDNAFDISNDSILIKNINNPATEQVYTVRVFGEPHCFTDRTIRVTHFDCNCPPIPINVSTPSHVCLNDTLPTLTALVGQSATVDWYDALTGGDLLKANSTTFKPTQIGTYYAEGKSLIQPGCISTQRVAVKVELVSNPSFKLTYRPATCLGDTSKADAQILMENLVEGDKFDYAVGSAYTGNANYENAQPIPQDGMIVNDLPNTAQSYTVRVFNRCGLFKDVTIQLFKNECKCSPSNGFPLQIRMKKK